MENKLPKVFKRKWLTALRNGKYKQGKSKLYDKLCDVYCCLGVAESVAGYDEYLAKYGFVGYITRSRIKVPKILHGSENDSMPDRLTCMNDGLGYKRKSSFKQIANWIEKNL